jgi:hypothetical protein
VSSPSTTAADERVQRSAAVSLARTLRARARESLRVGGKCMCLSEAVFSSFLTKGQTVTLAAD